MNLKRSTLLLLSAALIPLPLNAAFAQTGVLSYSEKFELRPTDRNWCGPVARLTLKSVSSSRLDRLDANLQHFLESIGKALSDECPQARSAILTTQNGEWSETITAARGWKLAAQK